jgi:hypothetical protein
LFYLIKDKAMVIQHHRFITAVVQFPLELAIKLHLPLNILELLHSCIFIIYYLIIFILCAFWLRNEHVALAVALLFVLLAARTFYWMQSELPLSLAALLLFYAGISRQAPLQRNINTLALISLIPVFIIGHPLVILPFLFLWTYDWLLNKRFKDFLYYSLLAIALATYQLREILLVAPGSYEANRMTFIPNLIQYYPDYLALQSFDNFLNLCLNNFLALPVSLIILSIFYIRKYTATGLLRLGLIWLSVLGYVFIINISYPEDADITYLENMFLPLTIFIAIPFTLELLPSIERNQKSKDINWAAFIVIFIFITRIWAVWHQHTAFTIYQQWMDHLLTYTRHFPERKFIMASRNLDERRLPESMPTWALPVETMMISAQRAPDSAQTIYLGLDANRASEASIRPETVFGPFETVAVHDFPANYLRFPVEKYRSLNTEPPQDTTALRTYIATHNQVLLTLVDSLPTVLKAGRSYSVPVQLSVPSMSQPLHSGIQGPHPTLLRATFSREKGWLSDMHPFEAPLEVDVWHPWIQNIVLQAPLEPGRYVVEIGLISKNYRPWPVVLERSVEVK